MLLQHLLEYTRDGEWGEAEATDITVAMHVIRGTDYEEVRYGDLTNVPVRHIRSDIAARKVLKPFDILIETAGGSRDKPTGRSVLLKPDLFSVAKHPLICASFSRFLRVNQTLADAEYLFWTLQHLYNSRVMYEYQVQHTGVARFQYTNFASEADIYLPPLSEQRAIAHILGSLDDKIELNRRMNQTLEEMARAIFKSWFVDFDPVHAKARGEQPVGMDAATAALFPASFEDTELGPVPRGWRVASLDTIATFRNGLALQNFPPENGEFLPVIKIRELRQGYGDSSSGKASPHITSECIIDDGDIVFSWSGSLLVDMWCGGRGALNQHLFKVTSHQYPKWFYYYWTTQHLEEFQQIAADKATTMGHIKRHHLGEAYVYVPPIDLLNHTSSVVESLLSAILNNRLESRSLAELRDTLLPKLMSGEVRVPEAAEMVL